MSRPGEFVLRTLVSLSGRERGAPPPDDPTNSKSLLADWDAYIRWQFTTAGPLFRKLPLASFEGKRVLEIGCGTGGRTAFIAKSAALAVGIDVNAEEIETANALCPKIFPELAPRMRFLASPENDVLDIGKFDVVLMIDTLEHVQSPAAVLRLAQRYLEPGGHFIAGFIGFYHRHGSHMGMMPFVNVFFSDETILAVYRWVLTRPDYRRNRYDSDPPVERWLGLYDLRDRPGEYLNKITIRTARKLVRRSTFSKAELHVVGLGHGRPWLAPLNLLAHVPLLQEMFHSYVVVHGVL